jgi:hypothetical protein
MIEGSGSIPPTKGSGSRRPNTYGSGSATLTSTGSKGTFGLPEGELARGGDEENAPEIFLLKARSYLNSRETRRRPDLQSCRGSQ